MNLTILQDYLAVRHVLCPCTVSDTDETHQEPNTNTKLNMRHGLTTVEPAR